MLRPVAAPGTGLLAPAPVHHRLACRPVHHCPATGRDAYGLLVAAPAHASATFQFFDAFQWSVWFAIVLTCICVGAVVWAIDVASLAGARRLAAARQEQPAQAPAAAGARRKWWAAEQPLLNEKVWEGIGRPMGVSSGRAALSLPR